MQLGSMPQTHLGSNTKYQKSPKNSLYAPEPFNCACALMYEHITASSFVFLFTDLLVVMLHVLCY